MAREKIFRETIRQLMKSQIFSVADTSDFGALRQKFGAYSLEKVSLFMQA